MPGGNRSEASGARGGAHTPGTAEADRAAPAGLTDRENRGVGPGAEGGEAVQGTHGVVGESDIHIHGLELLVHLVEDHLAGNLYRYRLSISVQ